MFISSLRITVSQAEKLSASFSHPHTSDPGVAAGASLGAAEGPAVFAEPSLKAEAEVARWERG